MAAGHFVVSFFYTGTSFLKINALEHHFMAHIFVISVTAVCTCEYCNFGWL